MRARHGFALLLALAAVIVFAGLAALANVAAFAAIRESAALRDEAQAEASRAALRARVARSLARMPRGALLGRRVPMGGADTVLVVTPLAWPWHHLLVSVDGVPVVAELSRAATPAVPWCASVVTGGASAVAPNTLSAAASSACTALIVTASPESLTSFDDSLAATLVLSPAVDTLRVVGEGGTPEVWWARRVVEVTAGGSATGLVIAPVVRIAAGASVRGMVIAADSLIVCAGGNVTADEQSVSAALAERATLRAMGRRGLLLPP